MTIIIHIMCCVNIFLIASLGRQDRRSHTVAHRNHYGMDSYLIKIIRQDLQDI